MTQSHTQHQLMTYLNACFEEYKVLKAEILSALTAGRQVTTLSLAATAACTALLPYIDTHLSILLFIPFLFYGIAFTQLRYTAHALDIGNYLKMTLIPNIRLILQHIELEGQPISFNQIININIQVLQWEMPKKSPSHFRGVDFLPIAGSGVGIPIGSALFATIYYWYRYLRLEYTFLWQWETIGTAILTTISFFMSFYTLWWALRLERQR